VRESRLWAAHLLAGAALVVLLGIHMAIMHYGAILGVFTGAHEPVLGFAAVVARDRSAFMRALYVLLLGAALYHGLYGARGILREVWHSARAGRVIDAVAVIVGLGVFVYGVVVIVLAGRHAAAM
jgi:succinate dehydrogenase / fumarate reductase membrane anchor subunit